MITSNNDFVMLEQLRYALHIKRINTQLLEQLASSLRWILRYSQKYQIPLPEQEKIIDLIDKSIEIEQKLSTYQPSLNTDNDQPPSEQNQ